jgi:cytochrome c
MIFSTLFAGSFILIAIGAVQAEEGNASRGQRVFRACTACHSLEPDHNMTGPSLSGLFGRKAGTLSSFNRYSSPLKSSNIIWNEQTLDSWLNDPQHLIPGNQMTFPGIRDAHQRNDLLAYLKEATKLGATASAQSAPGGGMGGMMGGGQVQNLKSLSPSEQVKAISYCGDTYKVSTVNGAERAFWERNLRFKTDSSQDGPKEGAPAILPAGMMGDRASIIFSSPEEIGKFVVKKC